MLVEKYQKTNKKFFQQNGKKGRKELMESEHLRKMIIDGLKGITRDSLNDFYSRFGQLLKCVVDFDPVNGRNSGHITFSCVAEVCFCE